MTNSTTDQSRERTEREEIVLRNMDADTAASVLEDLQDLGIKREAIRVEP